MSLKWTHLNNKRLKKKPKLKVLLFLYGSTDWKKKEDKQEMKVKHCYVTQEPYVSMFWFLETNEMMLDERTFEFFWVCLYWMPMIEKKLFTNEDMEIELLDMFG